MICAAIVNNAVSMFGRVDILHNNVGIVGADGDTTKLERKSWEETLSVNLTGAMQIVSTCCLSCGSKTPVASFT